MKKIATYITYSAVALAILLGGNFFADTIGSGQENPNYVDREGITLEQKNEDVFTCKVEVGGILSQDLRLEAKDRCLKKKGYEVTSFPIPKCSREQVPEGGNSSGTPIRKPAEGACWTDGTKHASVVIFPEFLE